jgi:ATP-dependent helicase/DNAse subunit B
LEDYGKSKFKNLQREKIMNAEKTIAVEEPLEFTVNYNGKNVKMIGKADRIDSDGEYVSIVDFKTGSDLPTRKEIQEGKAIQLMGYLQSAANKFALKPAGCFYLKIQKVTQYGVGIYFKEFNQRLYTRSAQSMSKGSLDDLFSQIMPVWETSMGELTRGNFTPNPSDTKICDSCDYYEFCGIRHKND